MRNGFLGSVWALLCIAIPASAQEPISAPSLGFSPGDVCPWQPPDTAHDCRPNIGPAGYRYYGNLDYILWWTERDRSVPSLTANPAASPGNVLMPAATDFDALSRNGVRTVLGMWLDQQQSLGLELGGFWVADRSPRNEGANDEVAIRSHFHSQLAGIETQLRAELYRGTWAHFDLLAGFRYLNLDESLSIAERDFGADVITSDRFATRNNYFAGQLGGEMELHYRQCFLDIWGKAAFGDNCETVDVNGTTLVSGQALPGGILATQAVAGRHRRDEFAFAPEVGINIGYHLTQHLCVTAGYTFFYMTNVARPGEQADALLHNPQSSLFPFQSSEFWMQGLNLGFEFRF